MKHPPGRSPDEAAISSVLGAILLFGLFVVTMVTVQVQFVPRWEEEREARHVDQVVGQLGLFKSDADRLVTNATQGGITTPLTLGATQGFTFFRSANVARSEIGFTPSASGDGLGLASPLLRIQTRDGNEFYGLGEQWTTIPTAGTLDDIAKVKHLRVRVDMIPGNFDEGDSSTLSVYDSSGSFAGKVVVTFRDFPSEQALEVTVYNAQNTQISSGLEAFFQQTQVEYFYLDLLDDELLFGDVLAAADKPMELRLANNGLASEYTVVFTDSTGSSSGGAAGGLLVPNYASTLPSGALALRAGYQHLPDQTFILEHGAILVVQADGAAMLVPPNLGLAAGRTQLVVDWVVPGLAGPEAGLGGSRAVTMVAHAQGSSTQIEALAARLSFTIPTEYPEVWEAYLTDALELAGLTDAAPDPQYTITLAANAVQLDLFGPISAPADTTEDIFLRYQQSSLNLLLVPSG